MAKSWQGGIGSSDREEAVREKEKIQGKQLGF